MKFPFMLISGSENNITFQMRLFEYFVDSISKAVLHADVQDIHFIVSDCLIAICKKNIQDKVMMIHLENLFLCTIKFLNGMAEKGYFNSKEEKLINYITSLMPSSSTFMAQNPTNPDPYNVGFILEEAIKKDQNERKKTKLQTLLAYWRSLSKSPVKDKS
jgi:hypothetical protein